jgi:hypothetical protein
MMRAATFLWAFLAAISGAGLFLLKYQVQAEERHLRELHKDIAGAEQSIHVLKAEWSYLNDPLRLREQAEHHLGMHPMRANQMMAIDAIPMVGEAAFIAPGTLPVKGIPATKNDAHGGKPAAPAAPPPQAHPKVPPAKNYPGRVMTANVHKAKPKKTGGSQVASAKVRP